MRGQLRIDEMFAFVVVDDDGTEGIPAATLPSGMMFPLVGADMDRVESLRPAAETMAASLGKRVEVVRFTTREHVEWIEP